MKRNRQVMGQTRTKREREIEGRGKGEEKQTCQEGNTFGWRRVCLTIWLHDAIVIRSLFSVCLHTCKHSLHNTKGQMEKGQADRPGCH
jgi:hypothetical protein